MTIMFALYFEYEKNRNWNFMAVNYIFGGVIIGAGLAGIGFMLHPATRDLPYIAWISGLLFIAMAIISYFYWKLAAYRLLWVAVAVLVIRIAFNYTVIPSWEKTHPVVATKKLADELAQETAGRKLFVYWNPAFKPDPYFQYRYNNEIFTYYLSTARNEITWVSTEKIPGALYLAQWEHLNNQKFKVIKKIEPAWQVPVALIEFK